MAADICRYTWHPPEPKRYPRNHSNSYKRKQRLSNILYHEWKLTLNWLCNWIFVLNLYVCASLKTNFFIQIISVCTLALSPSLSSSYLHHGHPLYLHRLIRPQLDSWLSQKLFLYCSPVSIAELHKIQVHQYIEDVQARKPPRPLYVGHMTTCIRAAWKLNPKP